MAEFSEVMRQWRRMCNANCDDNNGCHEDCPLIQYNPNGCGAIYEGDFADHSDWTYMEKLVCEWAETHPEPQYPTWWEWLADKGIVPAEVKPSVAYELNKTGLVNPIPADIAEKLGLKPKEANEDG